MRLSINSGKQKRGQASTGQHHKHVVRVTPRVAKLGTPCRGNHPTVTPGEPDSPQKRYAALLWIIELVNMRNEEEPDEADRALGEIVMRLIQKHGPGEAMQRYGRETVHRALLKHVQAGTVDRQEVMRRTIDTIIRMAAGAFTSSSDINLDARVSFRVGRTEAGLIEVTRSDQVEVFLQRIHGSDARRFGRCQVCGNYFYAKRLPQPACSRTCSAALRARRWRDKRQASTAPRTVVRGRGEGED